MSNSDEELDRMLKSAMSEEQQPKRKGRPPGSLNKFTRELKEAMFSGAEQSIHAKDPDDPSAPGTVTQFLKTVADRYPDKYMQALMKFVPQQYHALKTELRAEVTYNSAEEVKAALEEAGLTLKQIEQLEAMLPSTAAEGDNDGDENE